VTNYKTTMHPGNLVSRELRETKERRRNTQNSFASKRAAWRSEGRIVKLQIHTIYGVVILATITLLSSANAGQYPAHLFSVNELHFDSYREPHGLPWILQQHETALVA